MILDLKKDGNVVQSIVNAVVAGFKDDLIIEELANAVETEKITKDDFTSAVDALKLYSARFSASIKNVIESMSQFEFNDRQSIIKNRPMNLAQQVMQDVEGFKNASDEFYAEEENDDDESSNEKEADIEKPKKPEVKPATKPAVKPEQTTPVKPKVAPVKQNVQPKVNTSTKQKIN